MKDYNLDVSILALQLHEPAAGRVRQWWDVLEAKVGISGVRRVPFPHVTLFGFDGLDYPQVRKCLEDFSVDTPPLDLRSVGLGVFLKPMPVIYSPVIRSPRITDLQRELWERIARLGGQMYGLYSTERWIPHITLAQFDLTLANQEPALRALMELDLELRFEVRNLTLFNWIGPRYEPQERYPLLGGTLVHPK
ncbi:MAG TPA: 2'-5' RNA ligase family protein [Holophaga sp.]|nr:2'-5' RNA ligase family protein [Holophaga sp.]HPS67709.1 2'-5' RNA ligase family protein [Holophaga sp.]